MKKLSDLQLRKAAEVILVANTASYVVQTLLLTGYPQEIARKFKEEELLGLFSEMAKRCDFESNDDIAMVLIVIALAVKGSFAAISELPRPSIEPRFLAQIIHILPQLGSTTRSQKVSLSLYPASPSKNYQSADRYQTIEIGL